MTAFSKNPPEGSGQSLNVTFEMRSLDEKSWVLLEDQLSFYSKNSFSTQKKLEIWVFLFFEQIRVTR